MTSELQVGKLFSFGDWPTDQVPRRAAGVYTIWRGDEFIYVGMSGRGAQREDFVANDHRPLAYGPGSTRTRQAAGQETNSTFTSVIASSSPGLISGSSSSSEAAS